MHRLLRSLLAAVSGLATLAPVQAIEFHFDYRYNSYGLFDDPAARGTLEAAGDTFEVLLDDLSSISPGGLNTWTAKFPNPTTGHEANVRDLVVPANTLTIFVGGRDLEDGTLGKGGFGGFSASGTSDWLDRVFGRGEGVQADVIGPWAHEFGPWGGAISFDTHLDNGQPRNWHTDVETDPARHTTDLFSVAVHELGHVLGIVSGLELLQPTSFINLVHDGYFQGPKVMELNRGEPVRLAPDQAHWEAETRSPPYDPNGPIAAMDPTIVSVNGYATRRHFTPLDFAALDDLGWTVDPSAYVVMPDPLPGDYNNNGTVEQGDLDLVLLNWGSAASAVPDTWTNDPPAGIVDQSELDGVLLNWGNTFASSIAPAGGAALGVPEPQTWALLVVAVSLVLIERRWSRCRV